MFNIRRIVAKLLGRSSCVCSGPTIMYLSTSPQDYAGAGGRTRIVSEITYGVADTYEVVLLCFVPVRKYLRFRALRRARADLAEATGARVYYIPSLPSRNSRLLGSISQTLSGLLASLICRRHRAVGIHAHGVSASFLALMAKSFNKKVWVLADMHGISPEEYLYRALSGQDPKLLARLENKETDVLNNADWVVFVSESMRRHYETKYGVVPRCFSVVPCATPARSLSSVEDAKEARQKYGLDEKCVFAYLGSIRPYQLVDETIELFKGISEKMPKAFLLVITSHADEFRSRLTQGGITPEQSLVVSVSHEEVPGLLRTADLGFLLRSDSPVNRVASPTKFAEYCLCGVPVITTPFVGDFSSMVEQHGVGHVVSSFSADNYLLDFIRSVREARQTYAERCNVFASRYLSWDVHGETLRSAYDKLEAASDGSGKHLERGCTA